MEFPVGLGGITLVIAALVWLLAFVPGYTQKSQIAETTKFVRQQQRESDKAKPLTRDEQLSRLLNTQRWFAILFALALIATVAIALFAQFLAGLAFATAVFAVLSLVVSRAAAKAATKVASELHKNRLQVRSKAQKSMASNTSRDWTPNPIPAPLSNLAKMEPIETPIAEVISIDKPRKVLSGSEIDQILARRRAI